MIFLGVQKRKQKNKKGFKKLYKTNFWFEFLITQINRTSEMIQLSPVLEIGKKHVIFVFKISKTNRSDRFDAEVDANFRLNPIQIRDLV